MNLFPFFSEQDAQRKRSPQEFFSWVETTQEKFSATRERKEAMRIRKGTAKVFFSEIRPLGLLVTHLQQTGSDIEWAQPAIGDQAFDARLGLLCNDVVVEQKIEFAEAVDGHDEYLRMLILNRDGRVSATGPIINPGTKHKGRSGLKVPSVARLRVENLDEIYCLIRTALEKKVNKNYEPGVWLVIVFADHMPQPFTEEHAEPIREMVAECFRSMEPPFSRILVLGQSGKVHADCSCSNPTKNSTSNYLSVGG